MFKDIIIPYLMILLCVYTMIFVLDCSVLVCVNFDGITTTLSSYFYKAKYYNHY